MGMTSDLVVIGGGGGGIGAAVAAARLGCSVTLVERANELGGNVTQSLVCTWEPGVGGTGIPFDFYRRLSGDAGAVGIFGGGNLHCGEEKRSDCYVGESIPKPDATYADSLRRHGHGPGHPAFQVSFRPEVYAAEISKWLTELGVQVILGKGVTGVEQVDGHVKSVMLDDGSVLGGTTVVDATAEAVVARLSGCAMLYGRESKEAFGEPSAPSVPNRKINGVTLLYRVTPRMDGRDSVDPLEHGIPKEPWWQDRFPGACVNTIPGGDLVINLLPTLDGTTYQELGNRAWEEARRRTLAHWHKLQSSYPALRRITMKGMAKALGVREGARIVAERMLTEHDLVSGLSGQEDPDIIALADHPMDTHGEKGGLHNVEAPYGVPFRCLIPKGYSNLLVACRGAGFTSLAASSCRLTRTMMQLGQAAGTAAALGKSHGCQARQVPAADLRDALSKQGVALAWPMEPAVMDRLGTTRGWVTGN